MEVTRLCLVPVSSQVVAIGMLWATRVNSAPHFIKPFLFRYGGASPAYWPQQNYQQQQQFAVQEQRPPVTKTIYVILEEDNNSASKEPHRQYVPQQPQPQRIYIHQQPYFNGQRPSVPQQQQRPYSGSYGQTELPPIITVSVVEAEPVHAPKPTYEYKPEPTYVNKPEPTYEYKPEPTYVNKPEPTYEYKPEPTYEYKPEPTYVNKPEPTYEYKPEPTYAHKPEPYEHKYQAGGPLSTPSQDDYHEYDAPTTSDEEIPDALPEKPSTTKPFHPPADVQPEYPEDNPPIDIRSGFSALPRENPK